MRRLMLPASLHYGGAQALRVFTLSGERCIGKVLDWHQMELTVEFREATACGAVNGVLRITPNDVQKVDGNVHPFWHAVTRPAA